MGDELLPIGSPGYWPQRAQRLEAERDQLERENEHLKVMLALQADLIAALKLASTPIFIHPGDPIKPGPPTCITTCSCVNQCKTCGACCQVGCSCP